MERQDATNFSGVSPSHLSRYQFASLYVRGRVLDAACGVGYGSKMLEMIGCEVTGVDISEGAIAHAERYFSGPRFIQVDVKNIVGSWDWIVSFETIEHLKNPVLALEVFRGCAKRLLCSVPNQEVLPFRPEDFKGDEYPHQRHYTPEEFGQLLQKTGWERQERHSQRSKVNPEVVPGDKGAYLVFACT